MYPAYWAPDIELEAQDTSDCMYTSPPHIKRSPKPKTLSSPIIHKAVTHLQPREGRVSQQGVKIRAKNLDIAFDIITLIYYLATIFWGMMSKLGNDVHVDSFLMNRSTVILNEVS